VGHGIPPPPPPEILKLSMVINGVDTKPGLWTLDWTMDWTMDWIMDSIMDLILD